MKNLTNLNEKELESLHGGLWYIAAAALTIAILNTDWDKAAGDISRGWNSI